jgi:hypothetical protein
MQHIKPFECGERIKKLCGTATTVPQSLISVQPGKLDGGSTYAIKPGFALVPELSALSNMRDRNRFSAISSFAKDNF